MISTQTFVSKGPSGNPFGSSAFKEVTASSPVSTAPQDVVVQESEGPTLASRIGEWFSGIFGSDATEVPVPAPSVATTSINPQAPKKWTVMIWSASDTNLYPYMQNDLERAENVGSNAEMNIVTQTDHGPEGGGGRRYLLEKNPQPGLQSPVLADLGDTNMADPKALSDFIQWTTKHYPAENYVLVMAGHGLGAYGLCRDDSKDSWMSVQGLQEGLQEARQATGEKLDVVCFDACLMGNVEAMTQLQNEADFLVGSEEIADAAGWDYQQALNPQASPRAFATNLVDMAAKRNHIYPTFAAYETAKLPELTEAVNEFSSAILNSDLSNAELTGCRDKTQQFKQFHDLSHFAEHVRVQAGDNGELSQAAHQVQVAVEDALVASQRSSSYPNARGISIELTHQAEANYSNLQFVKSTGWTKVLDRLSGPNTTAQPFDPTNMQSLLQAGLA